MGQVLNFPRGRQKSTSGESAAEEDRMLLQWERLLAATTTLNLALAEVKLNLQLAER